MRKSHASIFSPEVAILLYYCALSERIFAHHHQMPTHLFFDLLSLSPLVLSALPGTMMTDLLTAVARNGKKNDRSSDNVNYNTIRVGTLRKMLDEKKLDVDGSREAMIATLKREDEEGEDEAE